MTNKDQERTRSLREIFKKKIHIERRIGTGSFGQVFIGTYRGEKVALKILDLERIQQADITHDEGITKFIQEFAYLEKVKSNNVTQVREAGLNEGYYYIIMEYCDKTIAELKKGRMSLEQVVDIYYQAASGSRDMHTVGIVHG